MCCSRRQQRVLPWTGSASRRNSRLLAHSAISRATRSDTISIPQKGESVIIQASRPGRNGEQVFQTVVVPDGSKQVTQFGIDASGMVVHIDTRRGELEELLEGPE